MKIFVVVLMAGLLAMAHAQGNDLMRMALMMRMMGGGNSGSGASAGRPGASGSGGLSSMLGGGSGRGGINPLMLMAGGSDRMRDIMMCNMMPRAMRTLCMARAFQ